MSAQTIHSLVQQLDEATTLHMLTEPDDLRAFREGAFPPGTAVESQFPTLTTIDGMLRDFSMFSLNAALKLARQGVLHEEQLKPAFVELSRPYFNFLNYVGLHKLCDAISQVEAAIGAGLVRDDFVAVLTALYRLANRYSAWSFHYYPWQPDRMSRLSGPSPVTQKPNLEMLTPSDVRIRLSWEPIGISVEAWLAVDYNPELCEEFLARLPFTVLQGHAVVAGQSMLAWTPMVLSAPARFNEIIREAPVGRLRYSQGTGQKIVVQYGVTTENIAAPVLGGVVERDQHLLPAIGRAVWESTFVSKEKVMVKVEAL